MKIALAAIHLLKRCGIHPAFKGVIRVTAVKAGWRLFIQDAGGVWVFDGNSTARLPDLTSWAQSRGYSIEVVGVVPMPCRPLFGAEADISVVAKTPR